LPLLFEMRDDDFGGCFRGFVCVVNHEVGDFGIDRMAVPPEAVQIGERRIEIQILRESLLRHSVEDRRDLCIEIDDIAKRPRERTIDLIHGGAAAGGDNRAVGIEKGGEGPLFIIYKALAAKESEYLPTLSFYTQIFNVNGFDDII